MSRPCTPIVLTTKDRTVLENWVRFAKTEQRRVFRARVILAAAAGEGNARIAERLAARPGTVSKWRTRFAAQGLVGLTDAPRLGPNPRYGAQTEKEILTKLDEPPPEGYAKWNGRLIAEALGDVSKHQVWRVLRTHDIHLQRRRSWCISTDPEFASKAADIVGLYLNPPENAVVLSVDEKPHIQALERAQGWLQLPNGKAVTGYSHEYKRHGTTTLFAALNVTTGQIRAGHYNRRRRVEFPDFMNTVIAEHPHRTIHVVLDNLSTHKPKRDQWPARHKNVHFHYTPTHASWLNQIEIRFSILSRGALQGRSFTSAAQLREAIDVFIKVYNQKTAPFQWRKAKVKQKPLHYKYANLRN